MKAYVITTMFGVFAFDENGKLIDKIYFEKNAEIAAKKLVESKKDLINEEKKIIEILKNSGFDVVFVNEKVGYPVDKSKEEELKVKIRQLLMSEKRFSSPVEFARYSAEVASNLAKTKLKEVKKDKIIAHIVQAIDEVEKIINTLVERIREIYALYFPEMEKKVKDHEKFIKMISSEPDRDKIEGFEKEAKETVGMEFSDYDLEIVKEFSTNIRNLMNFKKRLEKYLEDLMEETAPNLKEIAGTKLGAKLIKAAGGLEKLAKLPSSTIQLLGAEKALFRFLRGRGKPPKHGYIFVHPYIQSAPKRLRGKIARALASKIMVAARIDFFSKEYRADEIKKDLEKRIKEIYESDKKKKGR